jgi:predicted nucleotidyltransferase
MIESLSPLSRLDPASLLPGVRAAVDEFKRRVVDRFGSRLRRFVLFGSYARSEAREDSDVDLLVVIDELAGLERDDVYETAADVWMETRVRLSPVAFSCAEWASMEERELLLAEDVAREGVPL